MSLLDAHTTEGASTYLRAPGVTPVRIATYPKRHRGFVNDVHLAPAPTLRPVAPIRESLPAEPCYADFFRVGQTADPALAGAERELELAMPVSA